MKRYLRELQARESLSFKKPNKLPSNEIIEKRALNEDDASNSKEQVKRVSHSEEVNALEPQTLGRGTKKRNTNKNYWRSIASGDIKQKKLKVLLFKKGDFSYT